MAGFASAFAGVGLPVIASIISVFAVLSILTVMLTFLLGVTRVWFSMSRDGLLPTWFSKVDRGGTRLALDLADRCALGAPAEDDQHRQRAFAERCRLQEGARRQRHGGASDAYRRRRALDDQFAVAGDAREAMGLDNAGQRHQSAPSLPTTVTVVGTGSLTCEVPSMLLSQKKARA